LADDRASLISCQSLLVVLQLNNADRVVVQLNNADRVVFQLNNAEGVR